MRKIIEKGSNFFDMQKLFKKNNLKKLNDEKNLNCRINKYERKN